MKLDLLKSKITRGVAAGVRYANKNAAPALKAAETLGRAWALKNPSPLAVVGAAATTVTELGKWADRNATDGYVSVRYSFDLCTFLFLSIGRGWAASNGTIDVDGVVFRHAEALHSRVPKYSVLVPVHDSERAHELLAQLVSRAVPRWIEGHMNWRGMATYGQDIPPSIPSPIKSEPADLIISRTKPFFDAGVRRAILIHGRPGVGKSCAATYIADALGADHIVWATMLKNRNMVTDVPRVVSSKKLILILDDVDKVSLGTSDYRLLREPYLLTILTANNGTDDKVLDGSLVRPGSIDETFHMESPGFDPTDREPLSQLSPEVRDCIRGWSVAALNEVALRVKHFGTDESALRLDDIETRNGMKCHSVKVRPLREES
jgi:hypothetical protein